MQKTELLLLFRREPREVLSGDLKKFRSADHVCGHERARIVDGAVNMGLRGKIQNGARLMLPKDGLETGAIGNVPLYKYETRVALSTLQITQTAGIGQLV